MTALTRFSACELSRLIESRQVSCVEVMRAYLQRIESLNPRFNALVSLRPASVLLAEAGDCDAQLARGERRGWLHGIPQAPKDTRQTRGLPTTFGSPLFANNIAARDDLPSARLRAHGALMIGKSNTPEFALGSTTSNALFGATANAFDPRWCAGGSSGGAAVAVALGLLPVADASDMMGSVRNPAAFNGLYGLRPTPGLIPSGSAADLGLAALSSTAVLARDVADLGRLLATLSGPDAGSPASFPLPDGHLAFEPGPLAGLRVGWLGDLGGYLAMEAGVLGLCRQAAAGLALACEVEDTRLDLDLDALWQSWKLLRGWTIGSQLQGLIDDPQRRRRIKPEALWDARQGMSASARQLSRAIVARAQCHESLQRLFQRYQVLALPSAQVFPFDLATAWPQAIDGRPMDSYYRWMEVSIYASLAACPVLGLPAGRDARGRPAGLQLIAPRHAESTLLRIAASYESLHPEQTRELPALST